MPAPENKGSCEAFFFFLRNTWAVHCILLFAIHKPDTESATGGSLVRQLDFVFCMIWGVEVNLHQTQGESFYTRSVSFPARFSAPAGRHHVSGLLGKAISLTDILACRRWRLRWRRSLAAVGAATGCFHTLHPSQVCPVWPLLASLNRGRQPVLLHRGLSTPK